MKEVFDRLIIVLAVIWSAVWVTLVVLAPPTGMSNAATFWLSSLGYWPLWAVQAPPWLRVAMCWAGAWGSSPWLFSAPIEFAATFGIGGLVIAGVSYYVLSPLFKK